MLELVFEDSGVSHRVPVRDGLSLGRSSDNDVVLRDFSVSRHHARIEEKDGELRLVDLAKDIGEQTIHTSPCRATKKLLEVSHVRSLLSGSCKHSKIRRLSEIRIKNRSNRMKTYSFEASVCTQPSSCLPLHFGILQVHWTLAILAPI